MEIAFSRIDDLSAQFKLGGATPAFANAFRRAMISEVPTLAIEDVRIYDNTSALFDEILAHRLGLIPIRTEPTSYIPQSSCSCSGAGCSACTATFTMSVEGPCLVKSRDMIPQDPSAAPALPDVPIVRLDEGQKVVIEAKAILGKGKDHAKWQPTCACGFKNYPIITVNDSCDGCGMCADECPRGILAVEKGRVQVKEGRLEECSLCRLCERACMSSGIGEVPPIRVTAEDTRFLFVLEGDGSLVSKEIIIQGLRYVKEQSDDLITQIDMLAGGR